MSKDIKGWHHVYSGKVRDLYESDDASLSHLILVVASDRVSAFDTILSPEIPNKGEYLTTLTAWWFDRLMFLITYPEKFLFLKRWQDERWCVRS